MDETIPISKSQRKREMHALQDLGTELIELSREQLARIELPENLREAVLEMHRLTKHEARRRQTQYIGRLMRDVDPIPIQAAISDLKGLSHKAVAQQHRLEHLRDQLMENEATLGTIAEAHANADITRLRQLRRNALKERELNKPPRSYREIFRVLRDLENNTRHD